MSILEEIYKWSQDLPSWQQDAIARLYADRTLTDEDIDDLYALAKIDAGIPDNKDRKATKIQSTQISASSNPKRLVQITEVRNLVNVNALSEHAQLPISPVGLTVTYGENGTGKSGYTRVFRQACRARDQREALLPNARIDPQHLDGKAKAIFQTIIDGHDRELTWTQDEESPEELSDISIFDSHCTRAYLDNHGDFAYVPYGLDILAGLVTLCKKLKAKAVQEKADNSPSNSAYLSLTTEQTRVAQTLNQIPAKTTSEDIEKLANMTSGELERLNFLTRTLAEADPKQKAKSLRQKAIRFTSLKNRIIESKSRLSDLKLSELKNAVDQLKTAKKTAELAACEFKNVPGQLPGTGGEEWKALFKAARDFAAISHDGHEFPHLPSASECPLCQNPLGNEGSERLVRFDKFIEQEVEKAVEQARDNANKTYKSIKDSNLNIQLDESLGQELEEIEPNLLGMCAQLQADLYTRHEQTLAASKGESEWTEVKRISDVTEKKLEEVLTKLEAEAKSLEETADENTRQAMVKEQLELNARKKLNDVKPAVLEAIEKHRYCRKLQNCIDGMNSGAISRKATNLSETIASQELADALNWELKQLKVSELKVVMKPTSPDGKTQFKMILELPGGGGTPTSILSEGEQRAIAIASFLAEVRLSNGQGGVLFDDPVSSLDHRRRWEVAERLAKESLSRQVIVFTHDIYFLCILEQRAQELGANLHKNYIRRTATGFGVHSEDLPFDVLGTKGRIGQLRQRLVQVRKAYKDGDEDLHRRLTKETYGDLRLAWERCIEEVLFNKVVQRFSEGISTQNLKEVIVTNEDYHKINAGMTKTSKFEHDAATGVGRLPIPEPDELSDAIEFLELWRNEINDRKKDVRKERT